MSDVRREESRGEFFPEPSEPKTCVLEEEFLLFGASPEPSPTPQGSSAKQELACDNELNLRVEEVGNVSVANTNWNEHETCQDVLINPFDPDDPRFYQLTWEDEIYELRMDKIHRVETSRLELPSNKTRTVFKAVASVSDINLAEVSDRVCMAVQSWLERQYGEEFLAEGYEEKMNAYLRLMQTAYLKRNLSLELQFPQHAYVSNPVFESKSKQAIKFETFRPNGMEPLPGTNTPANWDMASGYGLYLGETDRLAEITAKFTLRNNGGDGVLPLVPVLSGHGA